MPIHILPRRVPAPPISRRRFFTAAAGGAAAFAGLRGAVAAQPARRSTWALLADTHIHASDAEEYRGFNMAKNLAQVVREVLAARAEAVLVDGDVARLQGDPGDYARFLAHMAPLAEIPLHMTLGNHDHRDHFLQVLPAGPERRSVAGKYAGAVVSGGVQWIFLDSLDVVNAVPGSLGEAQRRWLAARLDGEPARPALLFVHHNPESTPSGLKDTEALLALLESRRQVKALFFGHTHVWRRWEVAGIHLVNLPAVGYSFRDGEPVGWVKAEVGLEGIELELRSLDPAHPEHGTRVALGWRPPRRRLLRV